MKIIMFGTNACKDCLEAVKALDERNADYMYLEFSESTANLKRFLKLRDTEPLFDGNYSEPPLFKDEIRVA